MKIALKIKSLNDEKACPNFWPVLYVYTNVTKNIFLYMAGIIVFLRILLMYHKCTEGLKCAEALFKKVIYIQFLCKHHVSVYSVQVSGVFFQRQSCKTDQSTASK